MLCQNANFGTASLVLYKLTRYKTFRFRKRGAHYRTRPVSNIDINTDDC